MVFFKSISNHSYLFSENTRKMHSSFKHENVNLMQVVLSDGDLSSLTNMALNLEQNQLSASTDLSERNSQNPSLVRSYDSCIQLYV